MVVAFARPDVVTDGLRTSWRLFQKFQDKVYSGSVTIIIYNNIVYSIFFSKSQPGWSQLQDGY